jgi:DUF1680 family protein
MDRACPSYSEHPGFLSSVVNRLQLTGQRSSELRGHFCGHYLSASAQLAANGDSEAKAKADYMVAELAKCQQRLGGSYLSAFPISWFDRL